MKKNLLSAFLVILVVMVLALTPRDWYPRSVRVKLFNWFGAQDYRIPPVTLPLPAMNKENPCPDDVLGWREGQNIAGIYVEESKVCMPDNPEAVAAFVLGTNNVPHFVLMRSKLAPDAVVKGADLDGDGDPDVIHIRLEVMELNGNSPDLNVPITTYDIAPGVQPGFWVFSPKSIGMSTINFESRVAQPMIRMPSPVIRVEQGDQVKVTLENTHYMPHTIHFHGVDHPFVDADGNGNDGVPQTSEVPVLPGESRTYVMSPRQTGTMFYHCHVQPQVHIRMGLNGMFVVEENRPNNWVQTLNVGGGHVRFPSESSREDYDREFDMMYLDVDKQANDLIKKHSDPRLTTKEMNRVFDITDGTADYFLLNGRSFPYTIRESIIYVKPDEKVKLRVLNGGDAGLSLHTHGHKVTITHYDGIEAQSKITRDVVWLSSAQRLDLELNTTNDGLHSYGEGIWIVHDHQETGTTTDGANPGGDVTAIVYEDYQHPNGMPKTQGVPVDKFFSPEFYQRKVPVWLDWDPWNRFGDVAIRHSELIHMGAYGTAIGAFLATLGALLKYLFRRRGEIQ